MATLLHRLSPPRTGHGRLPGRALSRGLFAAALALAALTGALDAWWGMLPALSVLALLVALPWAASDYRLAVHLAAVLLPLNASYLLPRELFGIAGLNPLNGAVLVATASLGATALLRPALLRPRWPRPLLLYVAVFAAATVHGATRVADIPPYFKVLEVINFDAIPGYLIDSFLKPMLLVVTAWLLAVVVANAARPARALLPFFGVALVLPLLVIGHVVRSGASLAELASTGARGFLSVIGMHANELGLLFNMVFALAFFCLFAAPRRWQRLLFGGVAVVCAAAVALTFSRGAYVGLLLVLVCQLAGRRRVLPLLALLALTAAAASLVPEAVTGRAATGLASGDMEDISAGRIDGIWLPLLPDAVASPLFGQGVSAILWSDAARHQAMLPVGHTHSAYLGTLLDLGLLGVAAVAGFFIHMGQLFLRLARSAPNPLWRGFFHGALTCIILLLVQGVTDDSFLPSRSQPFLWLSYGIGLGLLRRQQTWQGGPSWD